MIQEREDKHPMSTHMDTSGVLNTSVDVVFIEFLTVLMIRFS